MAVELYEIENGDTLTAFQLVLFATFTFIVTTNSMEDKFEELDFEGFNEGHVLSMGEILKDKKNNSGLVYFFNVFAKMYKLDIDLINLCADKLLDIDDKDAFRNSYDKGHMCVKKMHELVRSDNRWSNHTKSVGL